MKNEYFNLLKIYLEQGILQIEGSVDQYIDKILKHATIINYYSANSLVGFIAYYNNDYENRIAFLSMLVVKHDYIGKGIGALMLESSLKDLSNKNFKKYRLEVLKKSKAIEFYKSFDFEIEEEKENSFIMIKNI